LLIRSEMAGGNGRNDDAIATALTAVAQALAQKSREWWSWSGRPRRS